MNKGWAVLLTAICLSEILAQQGGPTATPTSQTAASQRAICDAAGPKLESGANRVILDVSVDSKGRVKSFTTHSPKGLRLEKMSEAVEAVKAMQFKPTKRGQQVPFID